MPRSSSTRPAAARASSASAAFRTAHGSARARAAESVRRSRPSVDRAAPSSTRAVAASPLRHASSARRHRRCRRRPAALQPNVIQAASLARAGEIQGADISRRGRRAPRRGGSGPSNSSTIRPRMNLRRSSLAGSRETFVLARAARSGIGFGLKVPSPRWLLISDAVTSAVPGARRNAGKVEMRIAAAVAVAAGAAQAGPRRLPAEQQRRPERDPADRRRVALCGGFGGPCEAFGPASQVRPSSVEAPSASQRASRNRQSRRRRSAAAAAAPRPIRKRARAWPRSIAAVRRPRRSRRCRSLSSRASICLGAADVAALDHQLAIIFGRAAYAPERAASACR